MPPERLNLFIILSFLVGLTFLIRGQKLFRWRIISQFLAFLLFLSIALALSSSIKDLPKEWLENLAIVILVIAAIVILFDFIFEAFGKIRNIFLQNPFSDSMPSYLIEACRAIEMLAAKKVGGLIVIERKENIEEFLGGGMDFNAQIKAEIICALFEKSSSVHDGAIIIRNGRVEKVRAILPVSVNDAIPEHFGTRHRSAIGITEKTDAITLVASEERGEISVAYQGVLAKADSSRDLSRLVKKALKRKALNL